MTSRDFVYWLQGFFELAGATRGVSELTPEQIGLIGKHLNMVFIHEIDPSYGDKEHQGKLHSIHSGGKLESSTLDTPHKPGSTVEEQLEFSFMKEDPDPYKVPNLLVRC